MKFAPLFNLKDSHFDEDGWATFDEIPNNVLLVSHIKGCHIDLASHDHVNIILTTIRQHPELTTFGKISREGVILLEGLSGLPMSSKCVEYCHTLKDIAQSSKVSHCGVYLDFSIIKN